MPVSMTRCARCPRHVHWVSEQLTGFIAGFGLTMEIFTYGLLLLGSIPIALAWLKNAGEQGLVQATTEPCS